MIREEGANVRVIERFLGILEFISKEPSPSFRKFIPITLGVAMDTIYPVVAEVYLFSKRKSEKMV